MSLFSEMKRRNVFRVGAAYLVAAWLLLQVVDVVGPILRLPDEFARYLLFILVIGLVPALVLAWAFEVTPDGVKRDHQADQSAMAARRSGRRLDRVIMVTLVLAVGVLLLDKLVWTDAPSGATDASPPAVPDTPARTVVAASPTAKSVAVLPFALMSTGPDDDYFADGLTEEIINALSQLPDLLVTARTSAFHFKGRNLPIAEIAAQLGVAHVVEGSVRRAGEQLRITAQLVRAADGFHLWSETYDRTTADTFGVQMDIAEKVARALDVFLDDASRERLRWVGTRNVEAFIAYQKGVEFYERAHREPNQISLLRQANIHFEQAIDQAPELFDAYPLHADLFTHILLSQAAGRLDGEITEEDLAQAPEALVRNYELAARHARETGQRSKLEFDRSIILGRWRGLDRLATQSAEAPGCEPSLWLHLVLPLSSNPEAVLGAFQRMAICDPLRARPMVHVVGISLWLGRTEAAIATARESLPTTGHPSLSRHLVLALALRGYPEEAAAAINSVIRQEDDLLQVHSMLASIRGDAAAADRYLSDFMGKYGPDERVVLELEAARGDRIEANRVAALIDARPFGYVVLLEAIYSCLCGAPFDLESTPAFAALLEDSGLQWPPRAPYELPLKDW